MKVTKSNLIFALVLLAGICSTEAGRLKGLKGVVDPAPERNLKKKGKKDKKDKKSKRKGPKSRSCRTSAKPDEVFFQCRSRSLIDEDSTSKSHSHSHSDSSDSKDSAVKENEVADSVLRTYAEDGEDKTRGVTITYAEGADKTPLVNSTADASELIKDEIKYVVKTSTEGIQVTIEYKQELAADNTTNKTETEFMLQFDTLVEYVKGEPVEYLGPNGTADSEAYDWGTDKIVQTIPLENWRDIPGIVSEKNSVVSYFTATADLSPPGVVVGPTGTTEFNFTVSEADVGEHTTANTMKIDVRILDFPWKRKDSYIALMSSVDSKKTVQMQYNDAATADGKQATLTEDVFVAFEEELQDWGIEAFGEYTWESDAEVFNNELSTSASFESSGARRALLFDNGVYQNESPANEEPADEKPAKEDVVVSTAEVATENTPPTEKESTTVNEEISVTDSTTKIQVVATSPGSSEAHHQEIAYSFVGSSVHSAKEIYWDPEAGIGYYDKEKTIGFEEGYEEAEDKSAAWGLNKSVKTVVALVCSLFYVAM